MTRPLSQADGAAILAGIAARRSLMDLMTYEAALATGPNKAAATHPRILAAIAAKRAALMKAAAPTEPC